MPCFCISSWNYYFNLTLALNCCLALAAAPNLLDEGTRKLFATISDNLDMKSLQGFIVYRKSVELLALITRLLDALPKGNAALADQLRRSSLSIPLNIAEGAGKMSLVDRRRYFSTARGSAFETYAILDACEVMALSEPALLGTGRALLEQIVAMLTVLTGQAPPQKQKKIDHGHAGVQRQV